MANQSTIDQFLDTVQTDQVVDKWIQKWKKSCLLTEKENFLWEDIHKEWEAWIPEIANRLGEVTNPLESFLKNCGFGEVFVTILEKFIFYGYSTSSIEKMQKSSTCNKATIFNDSLRLLQCLECNESYMRTRILCAECFEHSEHRRHNYSMPVVLVGYCCCGEKDTWENVWYCTKHSDLSDKDSSSLPADVKSRAAIVFDTIILYIIRLLNCYKLSHRQAYEREDLFYNITFYGDCEPFPSELKRIFDAHGGNTLECQKSMVLNGTATIKLSKNDCQAIALRYKKNNFNIKAAAFHITDVIHQNFVWKLLSYLKKCLSYGKKFRRIFSEPMLSKFDLPLNQTITEYFFIWSTKLPTGFRHLISELIVIGIMKDYKSKESLARMILSRSGVIMKSIDINKAEIIDYFMLVMEQLFEVPSLCCKLVSNENALGVIWTEVLKDCKVNYVKWEQDFEFDFDASNQSVLKMCMARALLRSMRKTWTKELREGFINGLVCFIQVLNILHGIHSESRRTGNHVEYDDGNVEYRISSPLTQCISYILYWCESDKEIIGVALEETLKMVNQRISLQVFGQAKIVNFLTYTIKCLPYDSKIHPVSIHLPLYRFLVSLFVMQLENCDKEILDLLKSKVFDSVLRIYAMLAQVTAGMWKRNGDSAVIRSDYYHGNYYAEVIDRDIQLLQIVASVTEPNEFLIEILAKFGLIDWGHPRFEENLKNLEEDEVNQVVIISEQFLQLLIVVLVERHAPELSHVTKDDGLKNDIIHCLCIKPASRSELYDLDINVSICIHTTFNSALEEIANFRNENGTYELKPKLLDRYNPLYYHYNKKNMAEAKEFQRQRRKAAGEPDCFPPTELPELKKFFVPMVNVFQCDVMLHIMRTVLERFLDSGSKCSSRTQLENVLYLIGYALLEEKSGRYSELSFTERAAEQNLFDCLERLLCSSTRSDLPKDLIKWTLQKYNEVAPATTNRTNEALVKINVAEETTKLKRSQLALARRQKMMQEITEMQKNFMTKTSVDHEEETNDEEIEETCMLCKVTQTLNLNHKVLVMVGLMQHPDYEFPAHQYPLLTSNFGRSYYTSSCGHVMHAECLQPHVTRSWNSTVKNYKCGFNPEQKEFLCPLCESICNLTLPLLPPLPNFENDQIILSDDLKHAVLDFTGKFQFYSSDSPLEVWKSLSYTIHVIETLLRHSTKPILGHLSNRHYECLKNFVRISQAATVVHPKTQDYTSIINELRSLLNGDPEGLETLIRFDIFGLLVTVIFSGIEFLDGNNNNILHILRLLFVAQIVKILMATNFDQTNDNGESEGTTPFTNILQILDKDFSHLSETFIWTYVKEACAAFLRCCVILFSFLTDVPPPVELTESGGDTFSNMCSYLGFPQTREDVFDPNEVFPYVQGWFKNFDKSKDSEDDVLTFSRHVNELIELPLEYFEIVREVASHKCSNNDNKEMKDPYICLVCGVIFCTGLCCYETIDQEFTNPLNVHMNECKSELYLKVSSCKIVFKPVMARRSHGVTVPGPYLDEFREADDGFNRNKPLYLSSEKYKELNTLWLSHGIYEKFSRLARVE